jgi:hypothetical protein
MFIFAALIPLSGTLIFSPKARKYGDFRRFSAEDGRFSVAEHTVFLPALQNYVLLGGTVYVMIAPTNNHGGRVYDRVCGR